MPEFSNPAATESANNPAVTSEAIQVCFNYPPSSQNQV